MGVYDGVCGYLNRLRIGYRRVNYVLVYHLFLRVRISDLPLILAAVAVLGCDTVPTVKMSALRMDSGHHCPRSPCVRCLSGRELPSVLNVSFSFI